MKHQSVTKTKYWHKIFSQLFSFTLRHKLCLSEYSPSWPFLHALCVFDRLDTSEAQSVLCLSVLECAAHAHTHTHTHTHFSLRNSVSRADCTFNILLSNMSSNLVTVKTAFYNNRQMIDLILTLSFGQGGTNVRRCEGKEVVLEETYHFTNIYSVYIYIYIYIYIQGSKFTFLLGSTGAPNFKKLGAPQMF